MKNSYEQWLESLDSLSPRWWVSFATQGDLQETTNSLIGGWRKVGDTEAKLRSLVGPRLFECVRAWVALPQCAMCGKEVTLGKAHEAAKADSEADSDSVALKDLGSTPLGQANARSWDKTAKK